jgi:two-component sensor histidine kinase
LPRRRRFALIIHQLATNAAKYGAFSVPLGGVSVEGRMNGDEQFLFRWSEKGSPAAIEPMRKGFSTTILLDAAKQFGQHAELKFDRGAYNMNCNCLSH